eukprot:TRINITY_DN16165_c0_g2_i1.p1 TRINITY_DN16165_c0_g2~~TRINITY_DN16165_c0_g2_i1.p1  ORF type:complete len:193 (+),score=18.37 TRINITY_DN16165_c0_g2_i1:225-803(+)
MKYDKLVLNFDECPPATWTTYSSCSTNGQFLLWPKDPLLLPPFLLKERCRCVCALPVYPLFNPLTDPDPSFISTPPPSSIIITQIIIQFYTSKATVLKKTPTKASFFLSVHTSHHSCTYHDKAIYPILPCCYVASECIVDTYKSRLVILSLIHISEPTRLLSISYAVFCLKKKKKKTTIQKIDANTKDKAII